MRHRIFQDSQSIASNDWIIKVGGVQTSFAHYTYVDSLRYSAMYDVVIPNFHRRMSKGEIFINPLYLQTFKMEQVYCRIVREGVYKTAPYATYYQSGGISSGPGITFDLSTLDPLDPYVDWNDFMSEWDSYSANSVTQAWANVNESEIQGLASLGEMPETVRWIASLFERAIHIVRLFKRKMVKFAIRRALRTNSSVETASAIWLEFRYAFRPLVYDMVQAMNALQKDIDKGSRRTARGWDQFENTESETKVSTSDWINRTTSRTTTFTGNFRAGVLYDISQDINGIMSVWGLDQPFEAIWELTPFSFIIDWFFNVGNVISSWSFNAGLSPLGSWVTEEISISEVVAVYNITINDPSNLDTAITSEDPGAYKATALYKRRVPNPSRAILPSINVRLDTGKILDLAAIGRQIYRSI